MINESKPRQVVALPSFLICVVTTALLTLMPQICPFSTAFGCDDCAVPVENDGHFSKGPEKAETRELVRNGDFNLGKAAWAAAGPFTVPSGGSASDPGGLGMQVWTGGQGENQAYLIQEIYPPPGFTGASFSMDYRLGARMQGAYLHGFVACLATTENGQFQAFHMLFNVGAGNYPGQGWRNFRTAFDGALLARIAALRRAGKPLYIWITLAGNWLALDLDNISLRIEGSAGNPAIPGVIAYSRGGADADGGYEIRGVRPDGTGDRLIFGAQGNCFGLAWRPDGSALAFAGSHEFGYSRWTADLYEVTPNGLRRITNPPAHADVIASGLPTGAVTGKIRNLTNSYKVVAVYVEGAKKTVSVSLAPYNHAGDAQQFTVDDVVDLGSGNPQYVVAREAGCTWHAPMGVDVLPNATAQLPGELHVDGSGVNYTAASPTWRRDGRFLIFTAGTLLEVPAAGGYGSIPFGWKDASFCLDPAWSPVDDRLLYQDGFSAGIWLVEPGRNPAQVVSSAGYTYPQAPAWLPDGSGFVYTQQSFAAGNMFVSRDLYLYRFADARSVQLTQFYNENAEQPVVSPDGRHVAFIRVTTNAAQGTYFCSRRELWVMRFDNPAVMWPVIEAGNPSYPDWGLVEP
jgi:hypothetical protein